MLNIGRLSPGAADYYLGEVADSPEDYYTGRGESAGRWMGSLARSIGLDGEVNAGQFRAVLAGVHPFTGEQLVTRAGAPAEDERRDQVRLLPDHDVDVSRASARLGVSIRQVRRLLWAGERPPEEAPHGYLVGQRETGRGRPWRIAASELERYEAASARRRGRPGFDVTLRPPKSVSLLWALGPHDVRATIRDAHHEAVGEVVRYFERHAVYARQWRDGRQERVETDGVIAAAFDHRTSRAGDPLLHTHVVTANMTRAADGRWHALDARPLYDHARPAGVLYQAHLRTVLTRRLGVEWEDVHNGWAEIAGIPTTVVRAFSKRREEIEDLAAESGYTSAKAMQAATLASRQSKERGVDAETLLDRWRDEALDLGFDDAALASCIGREPRSMDIDADGMFSTLAGAGGLTKHASSFTRHRVVEAIAERTGARATADDIELLTDRFLASPLVVPVGPDGAAEWVGRRHGRERDGDAVRWSTPQLVALEHELLRWAETRFGGNLPNASPDAVGRIVSGHPYLSNEQREMVTIMVTSTSGIQPVAGRPGAGKTTATAVFVEVLADAGVPVVGCALAATAAAELERACSFHSRTGRAASTIARFLLEVDGTGLAPGTVVVVDEASMVGTRDLHRIAAHVAACGGQLKLIGDPDQHGAVEAGGVFRRLVATAPDVVTLVANNRQDDVEDRAAIDQFREGNVEGALARYDAAGRVVRSRTAAESHERIVDDWWRAVVTGGTDPMIAGTNAVRRQLNRRARERLVAAGVVGGESVALVDGSEVAAGDWVVARRNNRKLAVSDGQFVKNGDAGRVVSVDAGRGTMRVAFDSGDIALPQWYVRAFIEHGYARTTYGVQGATLDHAFVHVDDRTGFEEAYVALTRGRRETHLYLVDGSVQDAESDVAHRGHEAVPTGLDTVAQAMIERRAGVMLHDVDPLVAAGLDARSTDLAGIALQRRSTEHLLASAPPDVAEQVCASRRELEELTARRRVLKPTSRKVRALDRRIEAASANLARGELMHRARVAWLAEHADDVDTVRRLRRLDLAREAHVRAAARADPPKALRALPGDAVVERAAYDAAETLAVHCERFDASPDPSADDLVQQLVGTRPDGGLAQLSYDRAARAITATVELSQRNIDHAPVAEVELTLF